MKHRIFLIPYGKGFNSVQMELQHMWPFFAIELKLFPVSSGQNMSFNIKKNSSIEMEEFFLV